MAEWLKSAEKYLRDQWGIDSTVVGKFALFLAYLYLYGLNPRITSGFRDPAKQKAMQAAWDRGDRQGLRARPATSSDHTLEKSGFLGSSPAARAIDIVTSNDTQAAAIARALGIGCGADFKTPDPGHYFVGSV
jgi:hypothetical protein